MEAKRESIEVLDIGLRRTRAVPIIRTVRPSIIGRAFSTSRPNKISFKKQRIKSAIALSHFTVAGGSNDTMDLRTSYSKTPPKDVLSPITPTSSCSCKSSEGGSLSDGNHNDSFPSLSSDYSSHSSPALSGSTTLPSSHSHALKISNPVLADQESDGSVNTNSVLFIPNKVPPPRGIVLKSAARDKDGFFISAKKINQDSSHTGSELSSTEDEASVPMGLRVFTPRDGNLKRNVVIKKPSPRMKERWRGMKGGKVPANPDTEGGTEVATSRSNTENNYFIHNNNVKRSFRYKKIVLRPPEKPIYDKINESESEEDGDSSEMDSPSHTSSLVPLPYAGSNLDNTVDTSTDTIDESYEDGIETDEDKIDSKSEDESVLSLSSSTAALLSQRRVRFYRNAGSAVYPPKSTNQHSQANSYSRVTVIGTMEESTPKEFAIPERHHVPVHRLRSQTTIQPPKSLAEKEEKDEIEENGEMEGVSNRHETDSFESHEEPSLSMFAEPVLPMVLPVRQSSDLYIDFSQNSLDDILVPPPEMFGVEQVGFTPGIDIDLESPRSKRRLSRTRHLGGTRFKNLESTNENAALDLAEKLVPDSNGDSILEQQKSPDSIIPNPSTDRNSTESNDTGYTSSTSPGYQNQINSNQQQQQQQEQVQFQQSQEQKKQYQHLQQQYSNEFSEGVSPDGRSTPIPEEEHGNSILRSYSSSHSLVSNASDVSRFYVPFVFHSKRVTEDAASMRVDPTRFRIQVCLVENSEELTRDLISLKSLESFSLVDAEEVEGEGNVLTSQVDDFTVETSLEDLEFGFKVVSSTQKDIFSRKVRQFTFEIKNLFGSSKPFSCDVEIRYADQRTVLAIEVV